MLRILPAEVKNEIRSGFAISSVHQCVEELVLNSLDAGASSVEVRADLSHFNNNVQVQVVDNGAGISLEDLTKIGIRHMTSKYHGTEDIKDHIYHGYRGEALASIIEVSGHVKIKTRASSVTYWKEFFDKCTEISISSSQRPSMGTTVTVYNIFYNLPVRRKSLNPTVEMEQIVYLLQCFSLAHHQVIFSFYDNGTGKILFQSRRNNSITGAFANLFGNELASELVEITQEKLQKCVKCYICQNSHSDKSLQFVFVNNRCVLKSQIHEAMNQYLIESKCFQRMNDVIVTTSSVQISHPIFIILVHCPRLNYDLTFDAGVTQVEFHDWNAVLSLLCKAIDSFQASVRLDICDADQSHKSTAITMGLMDSLPTREPLVTDLYNIMPNCLISKPAIRSTHGLIDQNDFLLSKPAIPENPVVFDHNKKDRLKVQIAPPLDDTLDNGLEMPYSVSAGYSCSPNSTGLLPSSCQNISLSNAKSSRGTKKDLEAKYVSGAKPSTTSSLVSKRTFVAVLDGDVSHKAMSGTNPTVWKTEIFTDKNKFKGVSSTENRERMKAKKTNALSQQEIVEQSDQNKFRKNSEIHSKTFTDKLSDTRPPLHAIIDYRKMKVVHKSPVSLHRETEPEQSVVKAKLSEKLKYMQCRLYRMYRKLLETPVVNLDRTLSAEYTPPDQMVQFDTSMAAPPIGKTTCCRRRLRCLTKKREGPYSRQEKKDCKNYSGQERLAKFLMCGDGPRTAEVSTETKLLSIPNHGSYSPRKIKTKSNTTVAEEKRVSDKKISAKFKSSEWDVKLRKRTSEEYDRIQYAKSIVSPTGASVEILSHIFNSDDVSFREARERINVQVGSCQHSVGKTMTEKFMANDYKSFRFGRCTCASTSAQRQFHSYDWTTKSGRDIETGCGKYPHQMTEFSPYFPRIQKQPNHLLIPKIATRANCPDKNARTSAIGKGSTNSRTRL